MEMPGKKLLVTLAVILAVGACAWSPLFAAAKKDAPKIGPATGAPAAESRLCRCPAKRSQERGCRTMA